MVPNRGSKLETIHAARHLDEYDSDVQATFKNCNGFIRTRRFDDSKSCLFDHFDGGQRISNSSPTIRMTARLATEIIGPSYPLIGHRHHPRFIRREPNTSVRTI